ncbi:hypothetical protein SNN71_001189 [Cronobacter sakazakii]|nr:hypothetical protein [Cronobacter sakazakii]
MQKHINNIGPEKKLEIGFPVGEDNFTFYEKNANIIAKLNDTPRDSIIKIYTYARSLIQSYKGYNDLIVEHEKILFEMTDNNKDKEMQRILLTKKDYVMVDYSQGIKAIDAEVRVVIDDGFDIINKEIKTLEKKLKYLSKRNSCFHFIHKRFSDQE